MKLVDMSLRGRRVASFESIMQQSDGFGAQVETAVASITQRLTNGALPDNHYENDPSLTLLTKQIHDRFGLTVHFIVDESMAAILPFYSNVNHIYLPEWARGDPNIREQRRLIDTFSEKKGSVNLMTAKLTGIFSEYDHPLYINFRGLFTTLGLTVEEITAVIFHELGHAFDACVTADRVAETNQVLAGIARNLLDTQTGNQEYIFRELQKITPATAKEAADQLVNGNRVVAGARWFKVTAEVIGNQMKNAKYNETAFEQAADSFASRFGYGRPLVLALEKLYKHSPDKSRATFVITHLVNVMATVSLAALVVLNLVSGAIGLAFVAMIYKALFLYMHREDNLDYTYDKLKVRYLRVRQDMIDQLKALKLTKENKSAIADLLGAIDAADTAIRTTREVTLLPTLIMNLFFKKGRDAKESISDQQLIESLASSDLFVQSAALATHN